jgi:hypothetical protein
MKHYPSRHLSPLLFCVPQNHTKLGRISSRGTITRSNFSVKARNTFRSFTSLKRGTRQARLWDICRLKGISSSHQPWRVYQRGTTLYHGLNHSIVHASSGCHVIPSHPLDLRQIQMSTYPFPIPLQLHPPRRKSGFSEILTTQPCITAQRGMCAQGTGTSPNKAVRFESLIVHPDLLRMLRILLTQKTQKTTLEYSLMRRLVENSDHSIPRTSCGFLSSSSMEAIYADVGVM